MIEILYSNHFNQNFIFVSTNETSRGNYMYMYFKFYVTNWPPYKTRVIILSG